ncbi:MAG: TolC family protein [Gemmatimonadaceae bacterium]|nr:TolC family protein [Gemmatimonadaceae bacterium]
MRLPNLCRQALISSAGSAVVSVSFLVAIPVVADAQYPNPQSATTRARDLRMEGGATLASLLALADSVNPAVVAARSRVGAARARVRPASAWDDPTVMAGILNLPLGSMNAAPDNAMSGGARRLPGDDMTMKMVGIQQRIPYPGKLSARRQIAEREADIAVAQLDGMRRTTARDIKKAYFELAYLDRAIELVARNQTLLNDIVRVTEAQYASGVVGQQDVLKARLEASRSGETASALIEERLSMLAELNALVDRDSGTPIFSPGVPQRLVDAAIAADPSRISFASQKLGARTAGSPLPSLRFLEELAVRNNSGLREMAAKITAQAARVSLAEKAFKPDFDVSLQYGQRDQRPDMVSAVVSIPIPIHKRSRQDQLVTEARLELAALEAEHKSEANRVRAEVARLVSDVERSRTQLALYRKAFLPQGEAAVSSALADYRSAKGNLLSVLGNQATLFAFETANYRALSDFAKSMADLEAIVGTEVLP